MAIVRRRVARLYTNPRVRRRFVPSLSSGGTTYPQSIAGAISPAGAILKQGQKILGGSVSPAGGLTRQARKILSGAVSPAGVITAIRTALLSLVGAISPGGSLSRRAGKILSGAVAPTGALTKRANRAIAGILTFKAGYGLRFYGNGTSNIDRVRIPLDPGGSSSPVDVGAGDFTIEGWLNCLRANNSSSGIADARNSNIFWDRDIWGDSRGWVAGVTRSGASDLVVVFGVAGASLTWATITGSRNVGDGKWHHVAIVRRQSTGVIELYVDGALDASGTYSTGNLSYPDGYDPGIGQNNPYLVLGAEKHDAGGSYPSYNGKMDELRISDTRRYTTAFTPPSGPFSPDANTMGLYHFNEATGTVLKDSATVTGAPTNGELLVGGSPSGPEWTPSSAFRALTIVRILILSIAGAVNPSGALVKRAGRLLTGVVSPTGTITRQGQKVLAGAMGPGGALSTIKTLLVTLAGAISPGGGLTKQTQRLLSGAIAPAGSLSKQAGKVLSGTVTPAGTLATIKTLLLAVAGAIAPGGAVTRQSQKFLSGLVTPAGSLSRQGQRLFGGAIGPAGQVSKSAQKILSGSVSPAGALATIRAILLTVSGVINPAGALTKQARRLWAGVVAPAGILTRQSQKALSGLVTPAGTLSTIRAILLTLAGAISPGGGLTRQTQKVLAGAVSPTGVVSLINSAAQAAIRLTLKARSFALSLLNRTIGLTLEDRE